MFEIIIRHIFNFQNLIILLFLVNFFLIKSKLKYLNLFVFILILLLGVTNFQNKIIKYYSNLDEINLLSKKNNQDYDLVVLGSNSLKRFNLASKLIDEYNIKNIIFIRDNDLIKEYYESNKNLFLNQNVYISKISTSTYEDFLIFKSYEKLLNDNVIILTDDFHIPRTKKLFQIKDKKIYFYALSNISNLSGYHKFDIGRGLGILTSITHEILANYYYKLMKYY